MKFESFELFFVREINKRKAKSLDVYTAKSISISGSSTKTAFSIIAEILKLIRLENRIHKNSEIRFRYTFQACD